MYAHEQIGALSISLSGSMDSFHSGTFTTTKTWVLLEKDLMIERKTVRNCNNISVLKIGIFLS